VPATEDHYVNAIGIGTAVGLGCIIALRIVAPDARAIAYFTHFFFYGGLSAFIFEIYRIAFTARHPFRR
jgi:hypothetical protein